MQGAHYSDYQCLDLILRAILISVRINFVYSKSESENGDKRILPGFQAYFFKFINKTYCIRVVY
jgi:hypothetical protein